MHSRTRSYLVSAGALPAEEVGLEVTVREAPGDKKKRLVAPSRGSEATSDDRPFWQERRWFLNW